VDGLGVPLADDGGTPVEVSTGVLGTFVPLVGGAVEVAGVVEVGTPLGAGGAASGVTGTFVDGATVEVARRVGAGVALGIAGLAVAVSVRDAGAPVSSSTKAPFSRSMVDGTVPFFSSVVRGTAYGAGTVSRPILDTRLS
jgi:hypothetical protein